MVRYRRGILWIIVAVLAACSTPQAVGPTPDAGVLNATRYPAVAVNEATVQVMRQTQEAQRAMMATQPTLTPSPLDMVADDPATFQLASGGLQFVEFFRFG